MSGERKDSTRDPIANDDPPDTIHAQYDWTETSPVEAVVELITETTNQDLTSLDPLYEHVEPETLTTLLTTSDGDHAPDVQIELTYADYEIILRRTGDVYLTVT